MDSSGSLISALVSSTNTDLVAKNLDLTRAVVELASSNAASSLVKAGVEIIEWLAREKVDKSDYLYFLERTKGITYPNEQGLEIRGHILLSEAKLSRFSKVGGIQLIRSGSLGRWMAFSDEHTWLVTTVAAMSAYYALNEVPEILVRMLLEDDKRQPAYRIQQLRLQNVMSKACQSIALHVINPGHSVGSLPLELSQQCGHTCAPQRYAEIISTIMKSEKDILVSCERFQAAIVSWLLVHFEGNIEISVRNVKIYTQSAKDSTRKAIFLVKRGCVAGTACQGKSDSIEVCERHQQSWNRQTFKSHDVPSKSFQNRALYEIDTYPEFRALNSKARNEIAQTARDIVSWLLKAPLEFGPLSRTLDFRLNAGPRGGIERSGGIMLHKLLYRWPNKKYAGWKIDDRDSDVSGVQYRALFTSGSYLKKALSNMVNHPSVKGSCTCPDCAACTSVLNPGCNKYVARAYLFHLIGHAIADGFGVETVSSMIPVHEYADKVSAFLQSLLANGVLSDWNSWFEIAALSALGLSPGNPESDRYRFASGNFVAVQNGSRVALASCLDLSKELTLEGCFHIEIAAGVIEKVQEDHAIITTELAMDAESGPLPHAPTKPWQPDDLLQVDDSNLEVQSYLVAEGAGCYKLFNLTSTRKSIRIVDPFNGLRCLFQSAFVKCGCNSSAAAPLGAKFSLSSLDTILSTWPLKPQSEHPDTAHAENLVVLQLLESFEKYNIALTLNPSGCIIITGQECWDCALRTLDSNNGLRSIIIRRPAPIWSLQKRQYPSS